MVGTLVRDIRKLLGTANAVLISAGKGLLKSVALTEGTVLGFRAGSDGPDAVSLANLLADIGAASLWATLATAQSQGRLRATRVVTADYAVAAGDEVIFVNATVPVTITLPAYTEGRDLVVVDVASAGSHNITIARTPPDFINGDTSYVLDVDKAWVHLLGSNAPVAGWHVVDASRNADQILTLLGINPGAENLIPVSDGVGSYLLSTLSNLWFLLGQEEAFARRRAWQPVDVTTNDYVIGENNLDDVIAVHPAAGGTTVHLPTPAAGRALTVVDLDGTASTRNITIAPHDTETINGAASVVISTDRGALDIVSDGTDWYAW